MPIVIARLHKHLFVCGHLTYQYYCFLPFYVCIVAKFLQYSVGIDIHYDLHSLLFSLQRFKLKTQTMCLKLKNIRCFGHCPDLPLRH